MWNIFFSFSPFFHDTEAHFAAITSHSRLHNKRFRINRPMVIQDSIGSIKIDNKCPKFIIKYYTTIWCNERSTREIDRFCLPNKIELRKNDKILSTELVIYKILLQKMDNVGIFPQKMDTSEYFHNIIIEGMNTDCKTRVCFLLN